MTSNVVLPLLDDIKTETAQQLLNAARVNTDPVGSTFIASLDEYIASVLPYTTTTDSTLNRGDVIEIQGPAASGKTHLLYFLTMTCLLPYQISAKVHTGAGGHGEERSILFGGRGKSVVALDCDGRWSVRRLYQLMRTYVTKRLCQSITDDSEVTPAAHEIVVDCLKRLHIFCPTSSTSLAATLLSLPTYHCTHMPDEEICMLFVDSISAFFWPDRWTSEQARTDDTPSPYSPIHSVLDALHSLISTHRPITVLTNWALVPLSKSSQFYKQHILSPYPAPFEDGSGAEHTRTFPLTHHLTLTPARIGAYPETLSFEEMCKETERIEAVRAGDVQGLVRTATSEVGARVGKFVFDIGPDVIGVH